MPTKLLSAAGRWILALVFLCAGTRELGAQGATPRDTLLAAAREIMETARYCGLVTLDESGAPRVRVMDPFAPDEDWAIWMGTHRESRKVKDIARDSRVTLYYHSRDQVGYVTISGRAQLVDEEAEKATRWKPAWEPIYEDRARDYLLIRVIPERMEVLHYGRGILGDPATWEPPIVVFGGTGNDGGMPDAVLAPALIPPRRR
jgi:general stress protein 26